jgi:osmotically-inducible protein OsmY
MKTRIFAASLITVLCVSINAQAAPAASATAGGSARVISPTVTPGQTVVVPGQMAPGTQPRPVVPPNRLPPSEVPGAALPATNQLSATGADQFPSTNQFATGTNGLGESNTLSAMGNSNRFGGHFALRDQGVTQSDRMLLRTLRLSLADQLGTASPVRTPVHFFIDNGAVTIVGTVPTADESQRILARVQATPGVLSVFNDLHVGTPSTVVQPQTGSLGQTITDHAFSSSDRTLLTTVEQEAALQLGINGASVAQMPVHFSIENGVVGATGQVASPQEKAALIAAIQRTPGVVRVVDDISLRAGTGMNTTVSPSTPQTGILAPTSRDGQTNNFMLSTTNSSGF